MPFSFCAPSAAQAGMAPFNTAIVKYFPGVTVVTLRRMRQT